MDAVQYLKIETYICNKYDCFRCPLSSKNNGFDVSCETLKREHTKDAVKIIEKFAKERGILNENVAL